MTPNPLVEVCNDWLLAKDFLHLNPCSAVHGIFVEHLSPQRILQPTLVD